MKKRFTKNKFLHLPYDMQHKKLSELLRNLYLLLIQKAPDMKEVLERVERYEELSLWIDNKIDFTLDKKNISKIADLYHFHLKNAKMSLKEHNLLPSIRTGDRKFSKKPFLENFIYLDNVRSAYNVGNIIRTTEALRIGSIYFAKNTPFTDNKKVIKTSMGTSSVVPCYKDIPLIDLPSPRIAIDTASQAESIFDFIFPKSCTIILGNEEYGISEESLKLSDYIVEIPMFGIKNSINVAAAYAIVASEIAKNV